MSDFITREQAEQLVEQRLSTFSGHGNPYHDVEHWEQVWELLHTMKLTHVMRSDPSGIYVLGDIYLGSVERVAAMEQEEVREVIEKAKCVSEAFEALPLMPWPQYTINATAFKYNGHEYVIITSDITRCREIQLRYDESAGYTGGFKPYETMLFVDNESAIYPFGDLPGHRELGVFQRYDSEEEARDGHQTFVTQVKKFLLKDK